MKFVKASEDKRSFKKVEEGATIYYKGINVFSVIIWPYCNLFGAFKQMNGSGGYLKFINFFATIFIGRVRNFLYELRCIFRRKNNDPKIKDFILFEAAYGAKNAIRVIDPVIDELIFRNRKVAIGSFTFQKQYYKDGVEVINYSNLIKISDMLAARNIIRKNRNEINRVISNIQLEIPISIFLIRIWLVPHLKNILISMLVMDRLIKNNRIKCFVSTCEFNVHGRLFSMISNQNNIPSVLLQHGITGAPDLTLREIYLSDHIGVYGPNQLKMLERAGVDKKKMHEVGSPAFERLISIDKYPYSEVFDQFNKCSFVITIGLNPFDYNDNHAIINSILSVTQKEGYCVILKLHPGDSKRHYLGIQKANKQFIILDSDEISLPHLLKISDLLITLQSNIAIDAILLSVQVVEINLLNREITKDYSKYVPQLNSIDEINAFFYQLNVDDKVIVSRKCLLLK